MSNKLKKALWLICGCLAISTLALAAAETHRKSSMMALPAAASGGTTRPPSGAAGPGQAVTAQTLGRRNRTISPLETEVVTVTPHGLEPKEITRPDGHFILVVEDRSGLQATSFLLRGEAGIRLLDLRLPREQPDWSDEVNLPPGGYTLTEAAHPGWGCRLTIRPR